MFQHYQSFGAAVETWRRRVDRVNLSNIVLSITDRDGATPDDLARFEGLPYRKIAFVARPHGPSSAAIPAAKGQEYVSDLYTNWEQLAPALTVRRLESLFGPK
jgi:uncharacterized protein (DUF1919 family)